MKRILVVVAIAAALGCTKKEPWQERGHREAPEQPSTAPPAPRRRPTGAGAYLRAGTDPVAVPEAHGGEGGHVRQQRHLRGQDDRRHVLGGPAADGGSEVRAMRRVIYHTWWRSAEWAAFLSDGQCVLYLCLGKLCLHLRVRP